MALWLDKHRPKKLSKLDFHKKQAEHLEKLVKSGDFPHLLVSIAYENYKINTNKILHLRTLILNNKEDTHTTKDCLSEHARELLTLKDQFSII